MLPRQIFGSTGHNSTRVIFGAAALGAMSQKRADLTLDLVRSAGINHIDTAASYGDSEMRLRPFLGDHRQDFFLATKTGERDGARARRELEQSLDRMSVDQVDLIQLHNLVEPDEFEQAHGPGGVVEAMVKARDEGLVRFIGVTGHGTRIAEVHLRNLERFPFDSVLLPYNWLMMQNAAYADAFNNLVATCHDRAVAVQTIKAVARRRWPAGGGEVRSRYSWYEPLPAGGALDRGVAYVLGRDGLFLNTSSDARILQSIIDAALIGRPVPDDAEVAFDVEQMDMSVLFDGSTLERI